MSVTYIMNSLDSTAPPVTVTYPLQQIAKSTSGKPVFAAVTRDDATDDQSYRRVTEGDIHRAFGLSTEIVDMDVSRSATMISDEPVPISCMDPQPRTFETPMRRLERKPAPVTAVAHSHTVFPDAASQTVPRVPTPNEAFDCAAPNDYALAVMKATHPTPDCLVHLFAFTRNATVGNKSAVRCRFTSDDNAPGMVNCTYKIWTGDVFEATSYTMKEAKCMAAAKALESLTGVPASTYIASLENKRSSYNASFESKLRGSTRLNPIAPPSIFFQLHERSPFRANWWVMIWEGKVVAHTPNMSDAVSMALNWSSDAWLIQVADPVADSDASFYTDGRGSDILTPNPSFASASTVNTEYNGAPSTVSAPSPHATLQPKYGFATLASGAASSSTPALTHVRRGFGAAAAQSYAASSQTTLDMLRRHMPFSADCDGDTLVGPLVDAPHAHVANVVHAASSSYSSSGPTAATNSNKPLTFGGMDHLSAVQSNPIGALNEYFMSQGVALPIYTPKRLPSRDDAPRFQCAVRSHDGRQCFGYGTSKKQAKKAAASELAFVVFDLPAQPLKQLRQ